MSEQARTVAEQIVDRFPLPSTYAAQEIQDREMLIAAIATALNAYAAQVWEEAAREADGQMEYTAEARAALRNLAAVLRAKAGKVD